MGPGNEDEDGARIFMSKDKRLNDENEGGDFRCKRPRISGSIDKSSGVLKETGGQEIERSEIGAMDFGGELKLSGKEVSCNAELNSWDGERRVFDLNLGLVDAVNDEFASVVTQRKVEIIDITSDESEDEEVKIIYEKVVIQKGKQVENENSCQVVENFLELELKWGNSGGSSLESEGRRYTREEKGKAKVNDSWLSLGTNHDRFEVQPGRQNLTEFSQPNQDSHGNLGFSAEDEQIFEEDNAQQDNDLAEAILCLCDGFHDENQIPRLSDLFHGEKQDENHSSPPETIEAAPSFEETMREERRNYEQRMREQRHQELRQSAHKFAWSKGFNAESSNQENMSLEDDKLLGKSPGPFSTALKMVRERCKKCPEQLIDWKPSNKGFNASRLLTPSLLDLSLKVLAKNAEAIVSLELVPDILRWRLADLICTARRMTIHSLELFVKGSPTEIRVKDCSWLTEEHFFKTFENFEGKDLMVLQLDLCGQCRLDYLIRKTLAKFSKSLPSLAFISLKGACRLPDDGLKALVTSAPALQSINLSQCSLLTYAGINILADSLGPSLRELYIDDCQKIDAILALPALKKFERLQVLSVAGIETVSDRFVHELIATSGRGIKKLDLANCQGLTNYSLKVIGDADADLCSLNISNLDKLTDVGLQFLADGCRSIQTLKLCRNKFSDEAIAAFLEASGESLMELSLNNIPSVGPFTAFSLAKCSRKLLSLDLSWCRKITTEALGLIVDSCLSLKLVKLFGCTQISNGFLNGHSNPLVQLIGLSLTPILENTTVLESQGAIFCYAPVTSLSDSY